MGIASAVGPALSGTRAAAETVKTDMNQQARGLLKGHPITQDNFRCNVTLLYSS